MNIEKLTKISKASFLNGIRIHFDSICLFKKQSYPSAYYLSVLAQEEIGKSILFAHDIWLYRRKLGYKTRDTIKDYKQSYSGKICNHRNKQAEFTKSTWGSHPKKIEKIFLGEYEKEKWKSVFVDINQKGKIIVPLSKIKEKKAKEQITILNDYFLSLCYFVKIDQADRLTDISTYVVEGLLDNNLIKKLKSWKFRSKMCEKRIKEWIVIINNKNESPKF